MFPPLHYFLPTGCSRTFSSWSWSCTTIIFPHPCNLPARWPPLHLAWNVSSLESSETEDDDDRDSLLGSSGAAGGAAAAATASPSRRTVRDLAAIFQGGRMWDDRSAEYHSSVALSQSLTYQCHGRPWEEVIILVFLEFTSSSSSAISHVY